MLLGSAGNLKRKCLLFGSVGNWAVR